MAKRMALVNCGVVIEYRKAPSPLPRTYRVMVPRKLTVVDCLETPDNSPKNDTLEFTYLTIENDVAIYTHDTNILEILMFQSSVFQSSGYSQGKFLRFDVDVRAEVIGLFERRLNQMCDIAQGKSPKAFEVLAEVMADELYDRLSPDFAAPPTEKDQPNEQ